LVLSSDVLPPNVERLDEFEENRFERILVPVEITGGDVIVANTYVGGASRR
jgi:hypothetical protein